MIGALAACVLAFLAASATAGANARLPEWISVSAGLSSSTAGTRGNAFPSESQRVAWERGGFGYVDLLWRIDVHIKRSGAIESRVEIVRHFLSESGISQGGNMDVCADSWRDELTIEAGYSLSAGSPPSFVDPETIEVISTGATAVFSDLHQIILPIPGLRPGSNATVVATRRFQSADFPLEWSWILSLGSIVPIAQIEVTVTKEPGALELEWASNDPDLDCTDHGGKGFSCVRSNVPALQLERDVLSYSDLIPHLYVGASESWSSLRHEVRALVDEAATTTPSLRAKVKDLGLAPTASREENLLKLQRFVANEIRYVSLSHGDSAVIPHPASLTLSRGYGDCKDKVVVLTALAKIAGLDVVPVLTSSQRKDRNKVLRPSSSYFDHMIACMDTENGERICVDPTQAYLGLELPPQLAGAISLPLDRAGEAALDNLGSQDFGWEVHLERSLSFERDSSLRIQDIRYFGGPGSAGNRSQILALSSADREAWVKRDYRDSNVGAEMPTFAFRSLRNADKPYEIESNLSLAGGYQPNISEHFGFDPWLVYYARSLISVNRHHPYRLLGFRYTAEETISLCCGQILHFGPELEFESKYGSLRRTTTSVDGKLIFKTVFELPSAVIPPEEVPVLESFIMQSTSESGRWFAWQPDS